MHEVVKFVSIMNYASATHERARLRCCFDRLAFQKQEKEHGCRVSECSSAPCSGLLLARRWLQGHTALPPKSQCLEVKAFSYHESFAVWFEWMRHWKTPPDRHLKLRSSNANYPSWMLICILHGQIPSLELFVTRMIIQISWLYSCVKTLIISPWW